MYLEQINGPQDVKKLSVEQLNTLADEMRAALLNRLSKHGGHFGPNFGMVEARSHSITFSNHQKIRSYTMYHISLIRTKC